MNTGFKGFLSGVVFLTAMAGSAVYAETPVQDGPKSQSETALPQYFSKAATPFVKTELSQTLAQNVVGFMLEADPNLEAIRPRDFNVEELPGDLAERKKFFENFYQEYCARIFAPGTEPYTLAETLLKYGEPPVPEFDHSLKGKKFFENTNSRKYAAFLRLVDQMRFHLVFKEFHNVSSKKEFGMLLAGDSGIGPLTPEQEKVFDNKVSTNSQIDRMSIFAMLGPVLYGKDGGELFAMGSLLVTAEYVDIFQSMGLISGNEPRSDSDEIEQFPWEEKRDLVM